MTRRANAQLLTAIRRGLPVTVRDHVPTIDSADEMHAFMDGLKACGRMTDETREACLRRLQTLTEKKR